MKYFKRSNMYKNSSGTCTLNLNNKTAYSYSWYELAKEIDGVMVLNTYNYSNTTCKHIHQISSLLDTLGYRELITIEAPKGLQDLDAAINHYNSMIQDLTVKVNSPRTKKSTNEQRMKLISEYTNKVNFIKILQGK